MTEKLDTKIEIIDLDEEKHYGKFVITPLEAGYGTTLGNSLRRVLLSSLPGAAITKIRIEGVHHELSTIEGVLEDVTEIILNLKGVHVKKFDQEPIDVILTAKGPKELVAGDLELDTGIEIANPDHHIATLNEDASITMEVTFESGQGYELAEAGKERRSEKEKYRLKALSDERKERLEAAKQVGKEIEPDEGEEKEEETVSVGEISIDALYTPVDKVNFSISNARVGTSIDYDNLELEVVTNGTVTPQEAVAQGAEILIDYLTLFKELPNYVFPVEEDDDEDDVNEALLNISIEDLDLSLRAFNCLKREEINTVGEVVSRSREEMMEIKNFGKKSMAEVEEKIRSLGLHFAGEEIEDQE